MKNFRLVNGIAAVEKAIYAYNTLANDVEDFSQFETATESVLDIIFQENSALVNGEYIANYASDKLVTLGCCSIPVHVSARVESVLKKYIYHSFDGKEIRVPVKIDYSKPFTVLIESDAKSKVASMVSEHLLFSTLRTKADVNFRCVDLASGGSFFTTALSLVSKFSTRSGGKVFTHRDEFSIFLRESEAIAEKSMSQLGGRYDTVWEYNEKNQAKIPEYVSVICLGTTDFSRDDLSSLKVLISNAKRNGMSFILVCDSNLGKELREEMDFQFVTDGEKLLLSSDARLPFVLTKREQDDGQMVAEIVDTMQQSEIVDTLYENHPELHSDYFTMDSSSALRIPFAIDKFNRLQYFEIGGKAPTHALLAGSTGSGKSSVLHTFIMQTMHHYHPDDVEIWAIDYKAVEFNFYIQNPTPHFRVIAHDTSTEFSLSLIDLLYKEYETRQKMFLDSNVKDIEAYRKKYGRFSMPRILVVIDEFQLMTQAVMEYNGEKDYRTELENLLRLTRAMGISFVFSSQTIASGLAGLSDAARDQIGCRLCLKHIDDNEIRETLTLSGPDANAIVYQAKELRRGQGIYKRARWASEHAPDGKGYEFLQSHILFLNEGIRGNMISEINDKLGGRFTHKDTITVRGGGRISVEEKTRHPFQRFINDSYETDEEYIEWYPAAPASLADYWRVDLERAAGANMLMVGENDDLRDSVVIHSICGFLMNPQTRVIANFVDEQNPDRKRLIDLLGRVDSSRFEVRVGVDAVMDTIRSLRSIRPCYGKSTVYLWYGMDKLKNEIFLRNQDSDIEDVPTFSAKANDFEIPGNMDLEALIAASKEAINSNDVEFGRAGSKSVAVKGEMLSYEQCVPILKTAFDAGPENGLFHFVLFNNFKSMKRSNMIDQSNFENIVATKMTTDDSYALFGTGRAIKKADDDTVIYSSGGDRYTPLRPYKLPNAKWFVDFNRALAD